MKFLIKWKWPLAAAIVIILRYIFNIFQSLAEGLYFRSFFQVIRVLYDYTLGLLPIPMVYILFCLLVYLFYKFLNKLYRLRNSKNYGQLLLSIINFISIILIAFYLFWGFNYHLPKVSERLKFTRSEFNTDSLYQEIIKIDSLARELRIQHIGDSSFTITSSTINGELENILRKSQVKILSKWNIPTNGRVRVRKLRPSGILLRLSTAGVYIPFVFEGHIDAGLHPIQYPFTMAHEMAHGYGITDEGECNFVGFVTCMNSEDPIIQYSGYITYFRYLLNNLRLADYEKYKVMAQNISPEVRKDLVDIRNQLEKYPDILPQIRDIIYDSYLKSHGISQGLASYSSIITLVDQWKNSAYDKELIKRTFPWLAHGDN